MAWRRLPMTLGRKNYLKNRDRDHCDICSDDIPIGDDFASKKRTGRSNPRTVCISCGEEKWII